MQKKYSRNQREYQLVMPLNLEEIIPDNDSVRLLSQILDELDYGELNRAYSALGRKPATPPRVMFKVMVYGPHCGVFSSRKMESACRRDVNFRWLLEGFPAPSKSTIAEFRQKRLQGAIEGLFNQLALALYRMGETSFDHLFVDGTKIEANANKYTFVWKGSINKHQARRDAKETGFLQDINERHGLNAESLEDAAPLLAQKVADSGTVFVYGKGQRKTQLQRDTEQAAELLEKKQRYEDYQSTFKRRSSFSKTDRDATFMHMKDDHMRNSQLKPGYNVQIGVSGEYIVGVDISSERSDQLTLIPLLKRMESGLGQRHHAIIADAGYESEENYTYLERHEQRGFIKPQNYEKSKSRKYRNNKYIKENMPYDAETNSYTCPAGRRIVAGYECIRKSKSGFESVVTRYQCESCAGCTLRDKCFRSKYPDKNREFEVSKTFQRQRQHARERIASQEGALLRINRSIQVEGAFAVIKEDYAFRRFLTRGAENVRTEMLLMAMGYNLLRLHCKIQSGRSRQILFQKLIA
ncbi:MAG: IS1182 family transposase [Pseudoflavonifractor sp.]|nr:IS1182 family transposase [Pseudoflavonifractor sp.]